MTEYYGTHITQMIATPPGVVDARLHGGTVKHFRDAFEIADTGNGDYYILFRVPVDAVVKSIHLACDDLTSGAVDLGVYSHDGDGTYTVVSVDCFADAIALGSGAIAKTDYTYNDAATDISKAMQPIWQRAGLSARPAYNDIYIGLTTATGTGATGTVLVELEVIV